MEGSDGMTWKVIYQGGSKHCINCYFANEERLQRPHSICPRGIRLGERDETGRRSIENCWSPNLPELYDKTPEEYEMELKKMSIKLEDYVNDVIELETQTQTYKGKLLRKDGFIVLVKIMNSSTVFKEPEPMYISKYVLESIRRLKNEML